MNKTTLEASSKLIRRGYSKAKRLAYNAYHGFPNRNVRNYGVISVIVPCYNVADYLDKCLRSILVQDYPYIEVVVVDDGSPDNSFEIARAVARKDRRVKIVRQQNRGLGGARNTGVLKSTGKFITFVDPDDTISRAGYLTMVQTLNRSGSDFVVGTMQRQLGDKRWIPKWALAVHSRKRLRTVLADDPSVLQDVFACNKLFRREFWNREVGSFPERIRYEDQKPTALAYSRSASFDVIPDVVYTWVIREDGTSITQGKANIEDLRDRLNVKRSVMAVLEGTVSSEVYNYWRAKAIGFDLESYFEQIPRTNEAYWNELQSGVRELAHGMDEDSWSQVTFHNRAKAYAALFGVRSDVSKILAEIQEQGRPFELSFQDGALICSADYLRSVSFEIPHNHRLAATADISAVFRLLSAEWTSRGDLQICGIAYVPGLATNGRAEITLKLNSLDGAAPLTTLVLPTQQTDVIDADEVAADSYASHQSDGFSTTIPASWFQDAAAHAGSEWQTEVSFRFGTLELVAPFNGRSNLGNAVKLNHGPLVLGSRIAPIYKAGPGLTFRSTPERPVASSLSIVDRHIVMDLDPKYFTSRGITEPWVQFFHPSSKIQVLGTPDPQNNYRISADLPPTNKTPPTSDRQFWQIRAGATKTSSSFVQLDHTTKDLGWETPLSTDLAPDLSPNGYIRLEETIARVLVTNVDITRDFLKVTISTYDSAQLQDHIWALVSTTGHRIEAAIAEVQDENTIVLDLPITRHQNSGYYSEKSGGYSLRLIHDKDSYWVPISPQVADVFPLYQTSDFNSLRISRTPRAGALWLTLNAPLQWDERGKFMQRRLVQKSRLITDPLENATLFESYGGKNCSDSPLELSKYLLAERRGGVHYWTIKDASIQAPAGTVPVILNSREYHRVLASSQMLVNNNNFPYYFSKRDGQKYIQTWHGTPLKKIGNDVPAANLSISYRELMSREAESWDVLVAQNEFSAGQLPQSFGYHGRTIASGYPRNDALNSAGTSQTRQRVRSELNLADNQLVVLYAPTWRDNQKTASNQYKLVSHLDPELLREQFGDSVTVLLRGHSNTAQGRASQQSDLVLDVTDYPDVNDLYLACDVLITDYSSVMFDYVNTGKPILFLVPDLESYAGEVRGFYLDFTSIAPGPLARTTEELAQWLSDIPVLTQRFAEEYSEFAKQFTSLDDGRASARVAKEWENAADET